MFTLRFGCKECGRTASVDGGKPMICTHCGHDNTPPPPKKIEAPAVVRKGFVNAPKE